MDSRHEDLQTGGDAYSTEIAELHQPIAPPDADQTPAQSAAYRHDIATLGNVFGTPGLHT